MRCTLFIDASQGTRVGPVGRTALGRLVEIAAGVAQANSAERDLTGLCLFDEEATRVTQRPGRGGTHWARMLDALTEAASLMPVARGVPLADLATFAYGLAQDLYPDWLLDDVNHFPIWLPLWAPQPNWSIPKPPLQVRGWWDWPRVLLARWFRNSFLALGQWRRSRLSDCSRGARQGRYRLPGAPGRALSLAGNSRRVALRDPGLLRVPSQRRRRTSACGMRPTPAGAMSSPPR